MLEIGGWRFPIDSERSKVFIDGRGVWGLSIRCKSTTVKVDGAFDEEFAPRVHIANLGFLGMHWHDFVGHEIQQDGGWGWGVDDEEDGPTATLFVDQPSGVRETQLRVIGVEGTSLRIELSTTSDLFIDDDRDKDVPLTFAGLVPFEGARFSFRAQGVESRDPARKAIELLSITLAPEGFFPPSIEPLDEPGTFSAHFAPREEDAPVESAPTSGASVESGLSPEERVLHESARELLAGMIHQEWIEIEEGTADKLVPGFVEVLEMGGQGAYRASRVSEWLLTQEEVIELHALDDDLAKLLDRFW